MRKHTPVAGLPIDKVLYSYDNFLSSKLTPRTDKILLDERSDYKWKDTIGYHKACDALVGKDTEIREIRSVRHRQDDRLQMKLEEQEAKRYREIVHKALIAYYENLVARGYDSDKDAPTHQRMEAYAIKYDVSVSAMKELERKMATEIIFHQRLDMYQSI